MGCNCKKGKKQVLNNLDSGDHIQYAKDIFSRVISGNTTQEFSDIDKIEIIHAYSTLYPSASQTPSIEDAINKIKEGIQLFDVKYNRKK
jgi:hypothetical protein